MVSLVPRKSTPPSTSPVIRERGSSLSGVEPISVSLANGAAGEEGGEESDDDTPTPRSRSMQNSFVKEEFREKDTTRDGPSFEKKDGIPLGFLRSSASYFQPRLRLLDSSSSSSTVPPFTAPVLRPAHQQSDELTKIIKTVMVFLKVRISQSLSGWSLISRCRSPHSASSPHLPNISHSNRCSYFFHSLYQICGSTRGGYQFICSFCI